MPRGLLLILAVTMAMGACKATNPLPLQRRVIRICAAESQIIDKVRLEAERLDVTFGSPALPDRFGRRMPLILIGEGFEIELLNTSEQENYELRVYRISSGRPDDDRAISSYTSVANALASDPSLACSSTQTQRGAVQSAAAF